MTERSRLLPILTAECEEQRARIRAAFQEGGKAGDTLHALCALADSTTLRVLEGFLPPGPASQGLCLLALGGYGRGVLFPFSDLDLLFVFANADAEARLRPAISDFSRTLWDLGFRVSPAGRTLEECKRIEEDNAEFHLALLDRRFLAGDQEFFKRLNEQVLPGCEKRARDFLFAQLKNLTQERHSRYGDTIFHLEPNVKEAPGGLRDLHAATWVEQIVRMGSGDGSGATAARQKPDSASAEEFLSAVRCFLHYRNGRNDNALTYELQALAAERSLGWPERGAGAPQPADWMRAYFRHARTLNRRLLDCLEEHDSTRISLGKRIAALAGRGRSPIVVRNGRLEVTAEYPLKTREQAFALLSETARRGMPLGRDAERAVGAAWKQGPDGNGERTWLAFRDLLSTPYPAVPLRSMHRLGLLTEILPELRAIDSLVIRDFYHRYTVDEHTLRTIEHLQELAPPRDERGAHFTDLWKSLDRRELLIFALLLHDVGKGMPDPNHVTGSMKALDAAAERLHLEPEEKKEAAFLIEHHLDMSATLLRRDIFDPETISSFANTVATPERLARLCLLTYADIHAVNPEALTPWKAEMLWQLLAATSNHLSRSVDSDRLHAAREAALLEDVLRRSGGAARAEIASFLEGFPRRYLSVHSAAEIAGHFALSKKLTAGSVQTELKPGRHIYTLTLLAQDRPRLFATLAGILAGWGMNIVKADAFANAAGVVLDTFQFVDLHRTLELNPSEMERMRQNFAEILGGKAPLEPLLKSRLNAAADRPPKVAVPTRIRFDDESSSRCTLLEILTQDRPGLLYDIGSVLAQQGCNIEVALIDTEGQRAIDVFYLTQRGAKLSPESQHRIATEFWGRI